MSLAYTFAVNEAAMKYLTTVTTIALSLALGACGGGSSKSTGSGGPDRITGPTPPVTGPTPPQSTTAHISWAIPTSRENGEALNLSDIDGYSIKYRKLGDETYQQVYVKDINNTSSYAIEVEAGNSYEFMMATKDTDGVLGKYSAPVQKDFKS